jgi:hypothetical protein
MLKFALFWLPFVLCCGDAVASEIPAAAAGPYAVGSTCMEVTPKDDQPMGDYLNGKYTRQRVWYVADLLTYRDATPVLQVPVPREKTFGAQAGTSLPLVLFVLYPTTRDNPRADYRFPYSETGDNVFPHMQRPGDRPMFAPALGKCPAIIYSGGYNTHGLWHLEHLKFLASHGYVVVDIFHGDGRCASFSAAMALRPDEVRAAIDFIAQDKEFSDAIDPERIGLSAASAGGHSIASVMGGVDPQQPAASKRDARVKAGVALVPYLGGVMGVWPFQVEDWRFGQNHAGLATVRTPFLAIYGEKDKNVPRTGVESAVNAIGGPVPSVLLEGETHSITAPANIDINTWELLFFNAWLREDPAAKKLLDDGTSVQGGVTDRKIVHRSANTNR